MLVDGGAVADRIEFVTRLETARQELQRASHYRYTVVNDDLDRAVDEICHIIASCKG